MYTMKPDDRLLNITYYFPFILGDSGMSLLEKDGKQKRRE